MSLLSFILQALLQVYKIILGLEMLGNPVGFVTGVKDGAIGLFYYPIQVSKDFQLSKQYVGVFNLCSIDGYAMCLHECSKKLAYFHVVNLCM